MKKIFIVLILLFSTISYGQLIPKEFLIRNINDVDSALVILTKAANQQKKMPASVEITKEYINQSKIIDARNTFATFNQRSRIIPNTIYYENITKVHVGKGWKIHFYSSITKQKDLFVIYNKEMAEEAFAALLCLIKYSGNENFDKILNDLKER